ncbi:MAG TPA: hypothetical protein VG389_01975 [Myxococcota bacterium]|jgi:hypothetical protein|nr:hypothetical protein [Myxococcota bacterium]
MENFLLIATKADNVPIVFMIFIFIAATALSFYQASKNDKLINDGRRDEVLKRMQD